MAILEVVPVLRLSIRRRPLLGEDDITSSCSVGRGDTSAPLAVDDTMTGLLNGASPSNGDDSAMGYDY